MTVEQIRKSGFDVGPQHRLVWRGLMLALAWALATPAATAHAEIGTFELLVLELRAEDLAAIADVAPDGVGGAISGLSENGSIAVGTWAHGELGVFRWTRHDGYELLRQPDRCVRGMGDPIVSPDGRVVAGRCSRYPDVLDPSGFLPAKDDFFVWRRTTGVVEREDPAAAEHFGDQFERSVSRPQSLSRRGEVLATMTDVEQRYELVWDPAVGDLVSRPLADFGGDYSRYAGGFVHLRGGPPVAADDFVGLDGVVEVVDPTGVWMPQMYRANVSQISADGRRFAGCSPDPANPYESTSGTPFVYDVAAGLTVLETASCRHSVWGGSLVLTPDGRTLLDTQSAALLWTDRADPGWLATADPGGVLAAASWDGARLVGALDQRAFLADASGRHDLTHYVEQVLGHDLGGRIIRTATVSHDGRVIAGQLAHAGAPPWASTSAPYVLVLPPACSDGLDGDGDGALDYPLDADCVSESDPSESPGASGPPHGCGEGFALALVAPAIVLGARRVRRPASGAD